MKSTENNYIPLIIVLLMSVLITTLFLKIRDFEDGLAGTITLGIGGFICTFLPLCGLVGVPKKISDGIQFVSGFAGIILFISNLIFSFINFSVITYIVVNGLILSVVALCIIKGNKGDGDGFFDFLFELFD